MKLAFQLGAQLTKLGSVFRIACDIAQLLRIGFQIVQLLGRALAACEFKKMARAVLKTNVASQTGREDYVRVSLTRESGHLFAEPLPRKSGAIFTLVKADGMIKIDLNQEGIEHGEEVDVILF